MGVNAVNRGGLKIGRSGRETWCYPRLVAAVSGSVLSPLPAVNLNCSKDSRRSPRAPEAIHHSAIPKPMASPDKAEGVQTAVAVGHRGLTRYGRWSMHAE